MTHFNLLDLIALDNIVQVFTFDERIDVRNAMRNRTDHVSSKAQQLLKFIAQHQWKRPNVVIRETEFGKKSFYQNSEGEYERMEMYHHPIIDAVQPYKVRES